MTLKKITLGISFGDSWNNSKDFEQNTDAPSENMEAMYFDIILFYRGITSHN